jgi:pyruvate-ferredoxin/flavodoxin oxidoreductase
MYSENRFKMLARSNPEDAKRLLKEAQAGINTRWQMYQYLAARPTSSSQPTSPSQPTSSSPEVTP